MSLRRWGIERSTHLRAVTELWEYQRSMAINANYPNQVIYRGESSKTRMKVVIYQRSDLALSAVDFVCVSKPFKAPPGRMPKRFKEGQVPYDVGFKLGGVSPSWTLQIYMHYVARPE